jgi:hypothetical protein
VVDPRAASVTSTFAGHDLAEKTSSVLWDKDKRIVSCGFGKGIGLVTYFAKYISNTAKPRVGQVLSGRCACTTFAKAKL